MNWTDLINQEIESTYAATNGLIDLVDDSALSWKPDTGENWMTTGQLLKHIETSCGFCCRGFVTGDWSPPDGDCSPPGGDGAQMTPEKVCEAAGSDADREGALDMLLPAEKMPGVTTVAEARAGLADDKQMALDMVAQAGEEDLDGKLCTAPWNPTPQPLGRQLLDMVGHLASHKAQLFYYLKLQGKAVNTGHLWGM